MVKVDRRRRKSQAAIMGAFIALLAKKELAEITMNEIAEQADVSRGTIYSNFMDKYDILDTCIAVKTDEFFSYCLNQATSQKFISKEILLRSFQYLEENRLVYKTLLDENGITHLKNHLLTHSIEIMKQENILTAIENPIKKEVALQFYSSAINGVIIWWIQHDDPNSAEEVTEALWALLKQQKF